MPSTKATITESSGSGPQSHSRPYGIRVANVSIEDDLTAHRDVVDWSVSVAMPKDNSIPVMRNTET